MEKMTGTVRPLARTVNGIPVQDGAGVQLLRIIGGPGLPELDPFLLLDQFKSENREDYIAGFPPHPHRGFETVTYMKNGSFTHEDSHGHVGHLKSGGVQWMTAGRGIIHSEMPAMQEGLLWGYQLWVNLPARLKMTEPAYQDLQAQDLPEHQEPGARVRVLAGARGSSTSPARTNIAFQYLDVALEDGHHFEEETPPGHNVFVFVHSGQLQCTDATGELKTVTSGQLALFGAGERVSLAAATPNGAGFLFASAERIEEPIVRYGPFVMNTEAEIHAAIRDYQMGVLHR